MGLHVTPHGTFYVQHSLRTGEVIQVLPVRRPETPSHLPSIDSLGITDNFIERRRATLAASNARASHSQDSLQRELASAGGERLFETGMAALAQRDDVDMEMSSGGDGSFTQANTRHDGPTAAGGSHGHRSHTSSRHGHSRHGHHHEVNTNPHHPEIVLPPPSMATVSQMLPVRYWPEAL